MLPEESKDLLAFYKLCEIKEKVEDQLVGRKINQELGNRLHKEPRNEIIKLENLLIK
jgi:hypothetical protein